MYDNKVNVNRTNKVWQFIYNDYSINNPVTVPYFNSIYPIDISQYNFFGLPEKLNVKGKYLGYSYFPKLWTSIFVLPKYYILVMIFIMRPATRVRIER